MIVIYIILALCLYGQMWSTFNLMSSVPFEKRNKYHYPVWVTSFMIMFLITVVNLIVNHQHRQIMKQNYKCPELERVDNVYRVK